MNAGVIGGILGAVIGIGGGIIGTWCSIRNTRGPRERTFIIVFNTSNCCFCPSAEVGSSSINTLAPK